jgi:hypothetical protein
MSQKEIVNWGKLSMMLTCAGIAGAFIVWLAQFLPLPQQVKEHEKRINALETFEATSVLTISNNFNRIDERLDWIKENVKQLQGKQAPNLNLNGYGNSANVAMFGQTNNATP